MQGWVDQQCGLHDGLMKFSKSPKPDFLKRSLYFLLLPKIVIKRSNNIHNNYQETKCFIFT